MAQRIRTCQMIRCILAGVAILIVSVLAGGASAAAEVATAEHAQRPLSFSRHLLSSRQRNRKLLGFTGSFSKWTKDQWASLTASDIASWTKDQWEKVPFDEIAQWSKSQLQAIPLDEISAWTADQVQSLSADALEKLKPDQWGALSWDKIHNFAKDQWEKVPAVKIATFNKAQIRELVGSGVEAFDKIQGWTAAQWQAISKDAMKEWTKEH